MPLFSLAKKRFDPYLSLAQGFAVSLRLSVTGSALDVGIEKGAPNGSTRVTHRTLCFGWTGVTDGSICLVHPLLCAVAAMGVKNKILPLWANEDVAFSFVVKQTRRIQTGTLAKISDGQISANTILFQSCMLVIVPKVVSPTAIAGNNCQRKQTQRAKSIIGVFSMMEAGVTNAARIMRALPSSTT
jgi:hypothetical protein